MPPRREVVLDSNVIAGITLATGVQRDSALARIKVAKRKGSFFQLSPTGLTELAATYYRSTDTLERLFATIEEICDGVLATPAEEMIGLEIREADPYSVVTSRRPFPVKGLTEDVKRAVKDEEIKRFYAGGAFGNDRLRPLLAVLDPLRKQLRGQIESFEQYVEARRLTSLGSFLTLQHGKDHIPAPPDDLEALWTKAAGWRVHVLLCLANEFRRLTGAHTKGEGCLSDIRSAIEAAYSHQIWTADIEFAECGKLVNRLVSKPAVILWDPRK